MSQSRIAFAVVIALAGAIVSASHAEEGATPRGPYGGQRATQETRPHLTDEMRAEIRARIDGNIAILEAKGVLSAAGTDEPGPLFGLPVRGAIDFTDHHPYMISNFVDQNGGPGIQDYFCDNRSYNGHWGTDYATWPRDWEKMDYDSIEVVAAAPGTIVGKDDGNYDRQCDWNDCNWNAVYVQHSDGSEAWYGHLKNGSLTTKLVGQTVERGEYLGVVGSSGCSTGPAPAPRNLRFRSESQRSVCRPMQPIERQLVVAGSASVQQLRRHQPMDRA